MTTPARRALRGLGVVFIVLGLIAGASFALPGGARRASASPGTAAAAHDAGPVYTTEQTLQVGDTTRDYLLGGAPPVSGGGAPLLLLFHGLDQSTTDFLSDINILTAAAQSGVIVAAPESPIDAWNDGRFGPDGIDDDGFAMAIINQLATAGVINPARVTAAGFSNGAGMAMELASRHPSQIAALVSVDGEILSGAGQTLPSGPVPAYFIHGTADSVQPIEGRLYASDRYPGYISEQDTINAFLAADGNAAATPTQVVAPHHKSITVGNTTLTQWAAAGAAPVTFASIAGMGHKWPLQACTQIAMSASLTAKIATATKTLAKLTALRKRLAHPGAVRTHAQLVALRNQVTVMKKLYTKQAKSASEGKYAAAFTTTNQKNAIAAMVPSAGVSGCETGGGVNTRATDFSANGLVLGVAVTAFQTSYTV